MYEYLLPPQDYITTHDDVLGRQPSPLYLSPHPDYVLLPGGGLLLLHGWGVGVIILVWNSFITALIVD